MGNYCKIQRRIVFRMLAFLFACITGSALAGCGGRNLAASMRLFKKEGTVIINDENGRERSLKEKMRFESGDSLRTEVKSLAGVSLDDTKIVYIDEKSFSKFER